MSEVMGLPSSLAYDATGWLTNLVTPYGLTGFRLVDGGTNTLNSVNRAIEEVLRGESKPFDFRGVFELEPAIDNAKIDARIEQGVLTLNRPKSEAVKLRKITVTD